MFQVPNGGVEPGPGGVHDHGGGVVDQLGDGSRDSAPSAGCAGLDSRARVMAATPVVLPLVVTLLPKPGDRPAQPLGSPSTSRRSTAVWWSPTRPPSPSPSPRW